MKNGFRQFWFGTLIVVILLLGFVFVCQRCNVKEEKIKKMNIGLIADEDEPYLDWMIGTIKNIDSVKYACEFHVVSEKEGTKGLKNGDYNCLFLIPSDYIASLLAGDNAPIIIRFGKGQTGVVHYLIRQIANAASEYILDTEAGIYSLYDFYEEQGIPEGKEAGWKLNLLYLEKVFGRQNLIQMEEVDTLDSLSLTTYYIVSGIVLFLLCQGLGCGQILSPSNAAFKGALKRSGIGYTKQIAIRAASFICIFLINYLCIAALALIGVLICGGTVPNMAISGMGQWIVFLIQLLPVVIMSGMCIFLIYEMFHDAVAAPLFLFFFVFVMGYLSGCFYPFSYLPKQIQNVGAFLPVRVQFQYVANCIRGGFSFKELVGVFGYIIIFYGITLLKWRISSETD